MCIFLHSTNFCIPIKFKHSSSTWMKARIFIQVSLIIFLPPFQSILQFKPGWFKICIPDHLCFLFIILQWFPRVCRIKSTLNKAYPQCPLSLAAHLDFFCELSFSHCGQFWYNNTSECPTWVGPWYKVNYTLSGLWVLSQTMQGWKKKMYWRSLTVTVE